MPVQRCILPGGGPGWKWGGQGRCYPDRASAVRQATAAYANGYAGDRLAFDAKSVRTIDEDGHLHVAMTNISKANVCPYHGNEIPDYKRLGLDPARVYQLLRDPDELRKAAPTFRGKPLVIVHRPLTAADHERQITVGAIDNDVRFDAPYLRAPLTVWDGAAIAGIDTDEQRELSCGYRYDADMTPGIYKGVRYDGVMRNIRGNHVALVESGRAGSDVVVGDAAFFPRKQEIIVMAKRPVALSRKALLASGALLSYVRPKLAEDARIDLAPLLKSVTAKNWKAQKPKIAVALDAALKGKLAADADIEDVIEMLDQLDDIADAGPDEEDPNMMPSNGTDDDMPQPATDPAATDADDDVTDKVRSFLTGKISPEDLTQLLAMLSPAAPATDADPPGGKEATPPVPPKKKDEPEMVTKGAMDAAIARAAKTAEQSTMARLAAIREAERICRPHTGEVALGLDSAEKIYRQVLETAEVDLTGVDPSAFKALVSLLPKPGDATPRPRLAMDARAEAGFAARFPNVPPLRVL